MAKDQYFVLCTEAGTCDTLSFEVMEIFDELGAARDYAKAHAKDDISQHFLVTQKMATFAAFVAVDEI